MDNVVGPDNSFVTCRKDNSSGDQIDEVNVDESLCGSVLALGQNEAQVRVDVLEEHRPRIKKLRLGQLKPIKTTYLYLNNSELNFYLFLLSWQ